MQKAYPSLEEFGNSVFMLEAEKKSFWRFRKASHSQ